MSRHIEYEESSGNVFADLGVPEPEEALLKSDLAIRVVEIIEERGLTQKEAAKLLHVAQPNISKLIRGELHGFSVERLMRFLVALGQEIDVVVRPQSTPIARTQVRTIFADMPNSRCG
jgi:predicted XRE-type DNA-binding protein